MSVVDGDQGRKYKCILPCGYCSCSDQWEQIRWTQREESVIIFVKMHIITLWSVFAGKPRPVSMPAEAFSGVSDPSSRPGAKGRKGNLHLSVWTSLHLTVISGHPPSDSLTAAAGRAACFEFLPRQSLTLRAAAASTQLISASSLQHFTLTNKTVDLDVCV